MIRDVRTAKSRVVSMELLEIVRDLSNCLNCAINCQDYEYDETKPYLSGHHNGLFERRQGIINTFFIPTFTKKPPK